MTSRHNCIRGALLAAAVCLATSGVQPAAAQDHFDFLISQDANGKLITGQYDDSGGGSVAYTGFPIPTQVYGFDVSYNGGGNPYWGDGEPGFRARPSVEVSPLLALPPGQGLDFDFKAFPIGANTANLFYWNGVGAVDFQPTATHRLMLKEGANEATVTGTGVDVPGFVIETTDGAGLIHDHIDTFLSLGASGEPTALGIYLVSLQFSLGVLTPSDPVYLVYATIPDDPELGEAIEEAHELAEEWVEANLLAADTSAVPEPSSLSMAVFAGGLGLVGLWARRRKHRRARFAIA